MDPAHCIAKVCPSFLSSPAVGDIVGVTRARQVSVPLQGWDRAQWSWAKRHKPHTCRRWRLLCSCPIFIAEHWLIQLETWVVQSS